MSSSPPISPRTDPMSTPRSPTELRKLGEGWSRIINANPPVKRDEVREMAQQGTPPNLRGIIWLFLSKTRDISSEFDDKYEELKNKRLASAVKIQIEKDLSRTFPDHPLYKEAGGEGQETLRRVLQAYAAFDDEVKYCQGMGFMTGTLLFYMKEEDAFWLLVTLMSRYNFHNVFITGFPFVLKLLDILQEEMSKKTSKLLKKMKENNVDMKMFAGWFVTLWSSDLDFKEFTHVWDCFLVDGWSFIIRFIIVVFLANQDSLLKMDSCDFMSALFKMQILLEGKKVRDLIKKAWDLKLEPIKGEWDYTTRQEAQESVDASADDSPAVEWEELNPDDDLELNKTLENVPTVTEHGVLTCSQCLGIFDDPVTLPGCKHSFCSHCVNYDADTEQVKCPVCKLVHVKVTTKSRLYNSELKSSVQMAELEESTTATSESEGGSTECGWCEEQPATLQCIDCSAILCEDCSAMIHKKKINKHHTNIKRLSADDTNKNVLQVKTLKCRSRGHSSHQADLFDKEKGVAVCSMCIQSGLSNPHNCISLLSEDSKEVVTDYLQKEHARLSTNRDKVKDAIGTLKRNNAKWKDAYHEAMAEVDKTYSQWREELKKEEDNVRLHIDEYFTGLCMESRRCYDSLFSNMNQLNTELQFRGKCNNSHQLIQVDHYISDPPFLNVLINAEEMLDDSQDTSMIDSTEEASSSGSPTKRKEEESVKLVRKLCYSRDVHVDISVDDSVKFTVPKVTASVEEPSYSVTDSQQQLFSFAVPTILTDSNLIIRRSTAGTVLRVKASAYASQLAAQSAKKHSPAGSPKCSVANTSTATTSLQPETHFFVKANEALSDELTSWRIRLDKGRYTMMGLTKKENDTKPPWKGDAFLWQLNFCTAVGKLGTPTQSLVNQPTVKPGTILNFKYHPSEGTLSVYRDNKLSSISIIGKHLTGELIPAVVLHPGECVTVLDEGYEPADL